MMYCSLSRGAGDQMPEFLDEQDHINALRHDQTEIQGKLQPARAENQVLQQIKLLG